MPKVAKARTKRTKIADVYRRGEKNKLDRHWRAFFLDHLAETSNVTAAAHFAGVNPSRAYKVRREDAAFARKWYAALLEGYEHLELETLRRLREGVPADGPKFDIANALRLLTLPVSVLKHLEEGRLSAGHARALVVADDPAALAEQVIRRGLSVRETEALVRNARVAPARKAPPPRKDADTVALEADLSANLGMKVRIDHKGESGGELRISYADLDQLDKICQAITR